MLKWLSRWLDRIFVVGGALLFTQVPEFFQQYSQRLAGHVEELKLYVQEIQHAAALSGKTVPEYIAKFLSNSDRDFVNQGALMEKMFHRWQDLHASFQAMHEASAFTRPFAFFSHLQTDIAYATLTAFKPAVALTFEGVCYAILGLFAGSFLFALFRLLGRGVQLFMPEQSHAD